MLTITLNFVEYVVEGVPTKERGAATATLKNYLENGRKLLQKGSTTQQKNDHFRSLQDTFETVKSQLGANVAETEIIGMSFLALLGVAAEFAEEDEKFHAKFVDGAGKMKAKLSPATVARESELFQVIDEFINDTEFQAHEELMDRFLTFKDRY
ncbi:hypothetical protein KR018_002335 [Drosophila ironensis]|nr:hypothetical protein KR018_002335 [Drosophila ironensis]